MIECKEGMSTRSDKYITMTAMAIFTRWLIAFVSLVTVEEKSIASSLTAIFLTEV